ncbi:hypothetical protein H8B02_16780 [Bradyrhizobium sp. Pear77]|uniref:hypothetical protein n=1 Tax=Bradyrhizobium altum TaxID=1571202 RepID=UPI001E2E55F5|nr:hypothetical protein [Bradyrhizobium altum]MCC8955034.1 hypothetical protein [Bradyrhizobium altum]
MATKAKKAKKKAVAKLTPSDYPIFIDVPGHPEQVERCDWDEVNNQPNCRIIERTPPRDAAVRPAGQVAGIHRKHRAARA